METEKKKFKLTAETKINFLGIKLFRIQATVSFGVIKKGEKGGWVSDDARVYGNAWVYGDAEVSGDARVYGDAEVFGDARVYGDAEVSGDARVYGDARVSGNAEVSGDARVYGDAWVSGDAWVYGNAWVYGDAEVSGDARVSGNARVYGNAWKKSPIQIQGTKNFVNICKKGYIKIGCFKLTFKEWKRDFKKIGKENRYTKEEIKEYGLYIDLIIKLYS